VAYGSDTRRVAKLLAEVAERHGLVQKEPAPQVLFQEFGDSILTFELRYWADVHQHNAAQIGSDLRHMIASTFAENGVVMAFPQRDLHLDATRPLQIEIVPEKKTAAPGQSQ
jgi:small-conductance mechanosensitive channel